MGSKPSRKRAAARVGPRWPVGVAIVAVVGLLGLVALRILAPGAQEQGRVAMTPADSTNVPPPPPPPGVPDEQAPPSTAPPPSGATAEMGFLPPLPAVSYPLPRPSWVVEAVYRFAAEHPEVMRYVPCFCGCERFGHQDNEDCFVGARDASGRVVAWDDHGMG